MPLVPEVDELPSGSPVLAAGLTSRPEVKVGDGYQAQLLGLAQSFFAELSRKERDFSVDLAHGSTMQSFICVFLLARGKNKSCVHKGPVLKR